MSIKGKIRQALGWLRLPVWSCYDCRKRYSLPHHITIDEYPITVSGSALCKACSQKKLQQWRTVCHRCKHPILTGEAVAHSGNEHRPYNHLDCSGFHAALMYCGIWGEGRLLTLDECFPGKGHPKVEHNLAEEMFGKTVRPESKK